MATGGASNPGLVKCAFKGESQCLSEGHYSGKKRLPLVLQANYKNPVIGS